MAITQTLSNALSGLNAAKRRAEVSSSNISNALTEGYGARELTLSARDVGGVGAGVRVTGMIRHSDPIVIADRRLADAESGYNKATSSALKSLEDLFGKTGDSGSLSARISAVEAGLINASSDPSSDVRLGAVVQSLDALSGSFRDITEKLSVMRERAEDSISQKVERLNASLQRLDELNDDIVRFHNSGHPQSGLIDQRQQLIDSIAEIVPVRELSREGGRTALMTTSGEMLVDTRPRKIGFAAAGAISQQMTFQGGALAGLTIDGRPVSGGSAVGSLRGGSLEASFHIRDTLAPEAHSKLDHVAADLVARLSDPAVDPAITGANDGLLTVSPLPPSTGVEGYAATLDVNPQLKTEPRLLRDGITSTTPGALGNATFLNGWSSALSGSRALASGGPPRSAVGHASDLSAHFGSARVLADRDVSFSTARRDSLLIKEQSQGVDTDLEMQNLMKIEQAYAANAKVVQTVDLLMQKLLEI